VVIALRGAGRVRLGTRWMRLRGRDACYVAPDTPHELYNDRRTALIDSLRTEFGSAVEVHGAEAGMHCLVTFPEGFADTEIAQHAAREKLWLTPLSPSYLGKTTRQGFILGFSSTPAAEMPSAVQHLKKVLTSHGSLPIRNKKETLARAV